MPARHAWSVAKCELQPADRLLEIGCGSGHALALAAEVCDAVGIDRSAIAIAAARTRHAAAIACGRVRLETLALADSPGTLGAGFTCVLAVNVNAFWTAPEPSFATVRRLLRRGGRLCLVYEPPGTTRADELAARLPELAASAGFEITGVDRERVANRALVGIRARRRS